MLSLCSCSPASSVHLCCRLLSRLIQGLLLHWGELISASLIFQPLKCVLQLLLLLGQLVAPELQAWHAPAQLHVLSVKLSHEGTVNIMLLLRQLVAHDVRRSTSLSALRHWHGCCWACGPTFQIWGPCLRRSHICWSCMASDGQPKLPWALLCNIQCVRRAA